MSSANNQNTDVRSLLHYVPEFRGKLFVIELDWSEETDAVKAEVLMDLVALQSVGVRLVVSLATDQVEEFYRHSTELEFRVSSQMRTFGAEDIDGVLERGQAVVLGRDAASDLLSSALVSKSVELGARKLVLLARNTHLDSGGKVQKFIHVSKDKFTDYKNGSVWYNAREACLLGIARVHLLEVRQPGVLINEIFSVEGVGTMFYTDSYRKVRQMEEEDISEVLSMIGRSVRNTHLVPRTYDEVKSDLSAYYVLEVDDNVVGCGALYEYRQCAEVACLYVKQNHEGTGYGAEMVRFLESVAQQKEITHVFALSNRAAHFFVDVLGYEEIPIDQLPQERRAVLLESGRDSRAFRKAF